MAGDRNESKILDLNLILESSCVVETSSCLLNIPSPFLLIKSSFLFRAAVQTGLKKRPHFLFPLHLGVVLGPNMTNEMLS